MAVELPMDVLVKRGDVSTRPVRFSPTTATVDDGAVEDAATALSRAERPLMYVGSGAQGAAPWVRTLATWLQSPVVSYRPVVV